MECIILFYVRLLDYKVLMKGRASLINPLASIPISYCSPVFLFLFIYLYKVYKKSIFISVL